MVRLQIEYSAYGQQGGQRSQWIRPRQKWARRNACPQALQRTYRRSLQPYKARGGSHQLYEARHRDPATSRSHHRRRFLKRQALGGLALECAEVGFAARREDVTHAHARAGREILVEIDEGPAQSRRELASNRGLSRAWDADEDEMRGTPHVSPAGLRCARDRRRDCGAARSWSRRRTSRPSHRQARARPSPRRSHPWRGQR